MAFNLWRVLNQAWDWIWDKIVNAINGVSASDIPANPNLTNRAFDGTPYTNHNWKKEALRDTNIRDIDNKLSNMFSSWLLSDGQLNEVKEILNWVYAKTRDEQLRINEENKKIAHDNKMKDGILYWKNDALSPERSVVPSGEKEKKDYEKLQDTLYWDLNEKQKKSLRSYKESEMYLKIPEDWTEFFIDTLDWDGWWNKISIYNWYVYVTPLDTESPRKNFFMDKDTTAYKMNDRIRAILQNWYDRKNVARYIEYEKTLAKNRWEPTDEFVSIPIITSFDLWKWTIID